MNSSGDKLQGNKEATGRWRLRRWEMMTVGQTGRVSEEVAAHNGKGEAEGCASEKASNKQMWQFSQLLLYLEVRNLHT